MKKSVNLTLRINEVREAISNYLKGKNISIPEDTDIEYEEDNIGMYAIASYTEDADNMKKSVNLTLNINEVKEAISDYLKRKDIYISKNAIIELLEEDFNSEYETSNSAHVIVSYSEDVDLDKAEDKPQTLPGCFNKDSLMKEMDESTLRKSLFYPGINYCK